MLPTVCFPMSYRCCSIDKKLPNCRGNYPFLCKSCFSFFLKPPSYPRSLLSHPLFFQLLFRASSDFPPHSSTHPTSSQITLFLYLFAFSSLLIRQFESYRRARRGIPDLPRCLWPLLFSFQPVMCRNFSALMEDEDCIEVRIRTLILFRSVNKKPFLQKFQCVAYTLPFSTPSP